ncbi:MAG: dihydrolipoyl dehydrogenase [Armatimonadetes bacterium]|nr:dihydrolipoyl dehydrogenase [Candidatus Hippobium faecium]
MAYDLIVLGGGPGGYLAAERAGHAGLKTAVIERKALGGTCLNEGCIPTKSLLYCAKAYEYALHSKNYGFTCDNIKFDHKAVVERKNKIVKTLVSGVGATMKGAKVDVIKAEGKIKAKNGGEFVIEADGKEYTSKYLIIATGSECAMPPIPGVKEAFAAGVLVTNREILDMTEVPGELVVIGGGVIGLEMAAYFNSIGSHVTVVEMLDHIAGPTDREISKILQDMYAKKGIDFKLGCKVTKVDLDGVNYEAEGKSFKVKADKVLMSVGRTPNTANIGLENINIEMDRRAIKTDEQCRTNVVNCFAIGDTNAKIMLAHTAYREAEVAVNTILGKKDCVRYNCIPSVIYMNPEIGAIGETEESAKAKGIDYKVGKLPLIYAGRFVAEGGDQTCICKILVDKKKNTIIGCHVISNYASEFIISMVPIIECEMRLDRVKEFVFPHPTVCEILREVIFSIK